MKTKLGVLFSLILAIDAHAGSATWNLNPATSDWNTATNWTPATVPNATTDIATFALSNTTSVSTSADIDLASIVLTAEAPSYTITIGSGDSETLTFWGEGVRNDSGIEQTVVAPNFGQFMSSSITFLQSSTAGENINYVGDGAVFTFRSHSSAGSATFYVGSSEFSDQGHLNFWGNSTAANATITIAPFSLCEFNTGRPHPDHANITILGGNEKHSNGGNVSIYQGSAEHATFVAEPATVASGTGGSIYLAVPGLTGGTFIANGSALSGAGGGAITINPNDAGDGTYTVNGATTRDGSGAEMSIIGINVSAGSAFITVNGGENGGPGGELTFKFEPVGSPSRIALFGNGLLNLDLTDDISGVTIGSLEGDGLVKLDSKELTIGSNNLSTTFSGTIQNIGSISKIGTGTLTLSGVNTYSGGTTITSGILLVSNVSGSGTGTGAVTVNAGTLGGSGIIAGAVTVGTNTGVQAFLAPSKGVRTPATLTIQGALTLNDDSTYLYKLDTETATADEVIANGVVIDSGAKFSLRPSGNNALTTGQVFTVINNSAATPIAGTFHNLADGAIVTVNGNNFQADYQGGDGNDLTLTVVP
jgi:autotransporter-associated beta strand protein